MAYTFNTGNPVGPNGSADARDLVDNAQVADRLITSTELTVPDRLGVARKTWAGMEQEFNASQSDREQRFSQAIVNAGYQFVGDYAGGITLTEYNQVLRDGSGEFWRAAGTTALPYTTTGAGVDEGGALVSAGDAVLRQDLADPNKGAMLVRGAVVYVDTLSDLLAMGTGLMADKAKFCVGKYRAAGRSSLGLVEYRSSQAKSSHNGYDVFSPTVPWGGADANLAAFISGAGETDQSGSGVFVALERRGRTDLSFIFDDGWLGDYNYLAPLFESYGARLSVAITSRFIGNNGLMSASQIVDLYRRGHEILNHTATHSNLSSSTELEFARAEVETSRQVLFDLGVTTSGYVAGSSEVSQAVLPAVKEGHGYAYTRYVNNNADESVYDVNSDQYRLSRFNIETPNGDYLKAAASVAIAEDKDLTFYGHNIAATASWRAALVELLDFIDANEKARIALPSDTVNIYKSPAVTGFVERVPVTGWVSSSTTLTPADDETLTVTATSTGAGRTITRQYDISGGDKYTFSADVVSAIDVSTTMGILFLNSVGAVITSATVESGIISPDVQSRRYSVTACAPDNAKSVRLYFRVTVNELGNFTIREPRITKNGTRILPEPCVSRFSNKLLLPAQTLAASASGGPATTTISLPNADLTDYSISGNTITFKKDGAYSVNIYSYDPFQAAAIVGHVRIDAPALNPATRVIGIVTGFAGVAFMQASTVLRVNAGDTATLASRLRSDGATAGFAMPSSDGSSAIDIQLVSL